MYFEFRCPILQKEFGYVFLISFDKLKKIKTVMYALKEVTEKNLLSNSNLVFIP